MACMSTATSVAEVKLLMKWNPARSKFGRSQIADCRETTSENHPEQSVVVEYPSTIFRGVNPYMGD